MFSGRALRLINHQIFLREREERIRSEKEKMMKLGLGLFGILASSRIFWPENQQSTKDTRELRKTMFHLSQNMIEDVVNNNDKF